MLKYVLNIALLCALLPGCSTKPAEPQQLRLHVLSYNIHHGEGTDGAFDYQRLADIIKRAEPDLVALQEVDAKTGRSKGVDQAARLGELTGMHHSFAEAMAFDGGGYGEAVLSKRPLRPTTTETIALTAAPGQEPRSVAVAEWAPADGPAIVFGGTHLCHQSAETRLSQVHQINEAIVTHPDKPTILAGDFNFTPDTAPYQAMLDAGWVDAAAAYGDPQPTIPSHDPKRRIDYVFVRPANAWRVIDVQVLDEPIASDHAPLLVELEYVLPR